MFPFLRGAGGKLRETMLRIDMALLVSLALNVLRAEAAANSGQPVTRKNEAIAM